MMDTQTGHVETEMIVAAIAATDADQLQSLPSTEGEADDAAVEIERPKKKLTELIKTFKRNCHDEALRKKADPNPDTPIGTLDPAFDLLWGRRFSSLCPNASMIEAHAGIAGPGEQQHAEEIVQVWVHGAWEDVLPVAKGETRNLWSNHPRPKIVAPAIGERPNLYPASSGVGAELTAKIVHATSTGTAIKSDKEGLNKAYELSVLDPEGATEALHVAIYAQVRSGTRIAQCKRLLSRSPEIYTEVDDILNRFYIEILRRMKTTYEHRGKLAGWINSIWNDFFFPEIQQEVYGYINTTRFVNNVDKEEDDSYKYEPYCVNTASIGTEADPVRSGQLALARVRRELDDPRSPLHSLPDNTKDRIRDGNVGLTGVDLAKRINVSNGHACRLIREDEQAFGRLLGSEDRS